MFSAKFRLKINDKTSILGIHEIRSVMFVERDCFQQERRLSLQRFQSHSYVLPLGISLSFSLPSFNRNDFHR